MTFSFIGRPISWIRQLLRATVELQGRAGFRGLRLSLLATLVKKDRADPAGPVRSEFMEVSVSEINDIINREATGDGSLIAALEEIQERYQYLPPEALILASEQLGLPLSQAYSVATFYNAFSLKPKGKHCLHVCMGTACHVRGSPQVLDRLESKLGIKAGETTRDHLFTLETVNCLGACALGPIVVTNGEYSGQMTIRKIDRLLKTIMRAEADL
jgi:NADH-quinone oxidoreductase subunit E